MADSRFRTKHISIAVAGALAVGLWGAVFAFETTTPRVGDVGVRLVDAERGTISALKYTDADGSIRVSPVVGTPMVNGQPGNVPVIEAVLATLEYSYSRRFDRGGAAAGRHELGEGARDALLVETTKGTSITLVRGADVAGGTLVWLGRDDDALLATGAEVDLIFPPRKTLISSAVVGDFSQGSITSLRLRGVDSSIEFSGSPLTIVRIGDYAMPAGVRVDGEGLGAFLRSIRKIRLSNEARIPAATKPPSAFEVAMTVNGADLGFGFDLDQRCGDGTVEIVSRDTSKRRGCVSAEALKEVTRLLDNPAPMIGKLIDRSRAVSLVTMKTAGEVIEVDPSGEGSRAAREWLGMFRSDEFFVGAAEPKAPTASITVEYESGPPSVILLATRGGRWLGYERGQRIGWWLSADDAEAIRAARSHAFRRLALSERDPTEIKSVRVGNRVVSGAALSDIARRVLSHLEATAFVANKARPRHGVSPPERSLRVEFHPPPIATGDPDVVTVELGADIAKSIEAENGEAGCFARLAGDPVVFKLSSQTCAALRAI